DRVWVTSSQSVGIGAGSDAAKLSVIGSNEATVGGAELPSNVPRRETSSERPELPKRAGNETAIGKATVATALNGSFNRVAKFAADGTSLVDSAITETDGSVGIGTVNPNRLFHLSMFGQPTFAFSDTRGAS